MLPSHDQHHFYALLPLLAILAALRPDAFQAVFNALGMVAVLKQVH